MYIVESKKVLTPQNGLNIYRGRTEDGILLTEIRGGDPLDIGVKQDAPELLQAALRSRRTKGMIYMGNLGDPYNPFEDEMKIVRKALKVIENNDHGVIISTHRKTILRDMDILRGIALKTKCAVEINLPTLDDDILLKLEGQGTMSVRERLETVEELIKAGISVIINYFPIIYGVNTDAESVITVGKCISDYSVFGFDIMDGRMAVPKRTRDFFMEEYKKRFPECYEKYVASLQPGDESAEITFDDRAESIAAVRNLLSPLGIKYDTKQIRLWKRQYENRQTGEQMSMF